MYWRMPRSEWRRSSATRNREEFRDSVEVGTATGILAYDKGVAVGWCSVAPRESHAALLRSRILRPIDDQPTWSIVCFVIARSHRRRGVMTALARAAVDHAAASGAAVVETYPFDHATDAPIDDGSAFMGLVKVFRGAGFVEVARQARHVVMRRQIARGTG
jgi:GNAT superfamily N-acetyltransferase